MTRSDFARLLAGHAVSGAGVAGSDGTGPRIISESDPVKFMQAFAEAAAGTGEVFLCDPAWGAGEREQLEGLRKAKPETGNLKPESGDQPAKPSRCGVLTAQDRSPRLRGGRETGRSASCADGEANLKSESEPGQTRTASLSDSNIAVKGSSDLSNSGLRFQVSGFAAPPNSKLPAHRSLGWLMIPTGGSSGVLKFARHDEQTIAAAVEGFRAHFALTRVNVVGVLPLHHVSGLMAWLRCALTGGEYRPLAWKAVENGDGPTLPARPEGWTISLVPTQLERLLRSETGPAWLKQFRIIFIGGGPSHPALLEAAAGQGLPLSLGYGMTETAAMVTALHPGEFRAGRRDNGRALPHAVVKTGPDGMIVLDGESLFRGYYPTWREAGVFVTADRGQFDAAGHLRVLGRADGIIITGGEKVNPAEVEQALRQTGEFADVVVMGLPDAEWGMIVVAVYPGTENPDLGKVEQVINSHLITWQRPKRYVALSEWPVNAAGKVNREEVRRRVTAAKYQV